MGRKNYLIDTNITIYYFGLLLSKKSEIFIDDIVKDNYYISVVNRIELLGNKGIESKEQMALNSFINNAVVINMEEEIILKTIEIRKIHSIKLPDAIIAATCLAYNFQLITNNTKDFIKIDGLKTVQVKLSTNN